MSAGTLIVGAGQAGLQLAVSLRDLGDTGPIALVGGETHPPYQRPPLSKSYLAGTVDADYLAFRSAAFYADADIGLRCGERVVDIALTGRDSGAGVAVTSAGRLLAFDRLALATGARPRRIELPGAGLDGVCYLRDVDDATDLRARLAVARHVVVVGGGFIGLEAAAVARAKGKEVTVVEAADRLMARAVAPVVSDCFLRAHTRSGTRVLVATVSTAFEGHAGRVRGVRLAGGALVPADLVLVGIGAIPRTGLAEQLGLDCDGGIVVDAHARTSHPGVVAAGDCTVHPHPVTGVGRLRLESVHGAVSQARLAAASLVGRLGETRSVPWFWSDQSILTLQIAGLAAGHDDYVVRGDPASERFSVLYYRHGQLLAVDAVNRPADYLAVRRALAIGASMPADEVGDPGVALKSLLGATGTQPAHDARG